MKYLYSKSNSLAFKLYLKPLIIILFLFTTNLSKAQEGWVTQTTERISVKFPSMPVKLGKTTFAARDRDSVAYVFDAMDIMSPGADSVETEKNKDPEMLPYKVMNILEQAWNVEFAFPVESKLNEFPGYKSNTVERNHNKENIYAYTIFIGTFIYNLIVIVPEGKSTKGKDLFFSSVMLLK